MEASDTTTQVSETDIESIWLNLMLHLCSRHRINARNGHQTDYSIESLRTDHYPGYSSSQYFKRVILELAKRHAAEIEVIDGNAIRLTRYSLDKTCQKYDPTYQKDFKY